MASDTLMFTESCTNPLAHTAQINQIFIKSTNIQAYPCGRRRSSLVDTDGNTDTTADQILFPFDPEARLNTEANNRKHSSLNGYTQTYLAEAGDKLSLALGGYLFNITLGNNYMIDGGEDSAARYGIDAFGANIIDLLEVADDKTKIYANILLEDAQLLSSNSVGDYFTPVLRDLKQPENIPSVCLDLYKAGATADEIRAAENYYFSGLSFSTSPLTGEEETRSSKPNSFRRAVSPSSDETVEVNQTIISLCVLEKAEGAWRACEPARLPNIKHGDTTDSIVVGTIKIEGNADIAGNLTVAEDKTVNVDILEANDVSVPYATEGSSLSRNVTTIKNDGINTPFIDAESLKADGIAVGNDISITRIVNDEDTVVTTVGEDIDTTGNITADGNITAKGTDSTIEAPNLEVTKSATIKDTDIETADITHRLNVVGPTVEGKKTPAEANIDKATIDTATISNSLTINATTAVTGATHVTGNITVNHKGNGGAVQINNDNESDATIDNVTVNTKLYIHNDAKSAEIEADKAVVNESLVVKGTITATESLANNADNLNVKKATITAIASDNARIGKVESDDLNQKISGTYYDVPVMFLDAQTEDGKTFYQLQISRVNRKN